MNLEDLKIFEHVKSIVAKISYKPNFEIKVCRNMTNGEIDIRILLKYVQDSNNSDPKIINPIILRKILTPRMIKMSKKTDRHIVYIISNMIRQMETHEIDEWLKVDGKRLKNPHPELNPTEILWKPN